MSRRRVLAALAGALAALVAVPGRATDAPHDLSNDISCTSCHTNHSAPGGVLTGVLGNPNLCFSCHNQAGVGVMLNFPWNGDTQSSPGSTGNSHGWGTYVTNPAHGAQPPLNQAMARRLDNGSLTCSVCHDQHSATANRAGSSIHTSVAVGTALTRTSGGGTGTLTLTSATSSAQPRGYLVKIASTGAAGTATYQVSYDNARTWSSAQATSTNPVQLDGANLTVTFAGNFVAGDQFQSFYVSSPFLRVSNADSAMCEDCHRDYVQHYQDVEGAAGGLLTNITPGTTMFSHPVGQGLNANGRGYDLAEVRDANGAPQSVGDGIATNDIKLDSTNKVRCMSCHAPHNASSNSLANDAR